MDKNQLELTLEYMDILQGNREVSDLLKRTVDFFSRKFHLINCSAYFGESTCRFFNDESYNSLEKALFSQMSQSKVIMSISNPKQDFLLSSLTDKETPLLALPIVVENTSGMIVLYGSGISQHTPFIDSLVKRLIPFLETCLMLKGAVHSAVTDSLTGIYNKAYFLEAFKREVERARRNKRPTSLIIFDLDDFKKYNDTKGHVAGDELLKELGQVIRTSVRNSMDIASRYGGEEFTIILPETDVDEAFSIAERLRTSVQSALGETISVGLVTCLNSSESDTTMLKQADKAAYISKDKGKNRTTNFVIIDKSIAPVNCQEASEYSISR